MAGLEVVVRPVIFPDIRPRARPSLPPQDDPTKGFAVIKGNPASSVGLSDNWNVSSSKSRPIEKKREVDEIRVYQKEDNGKINKKNFVNVERTKKLYMVDPNVGHMERDNKGGYVFVPNQNPPQVRRYDYSHFQESDNTELLKTDVTKVNPDAPKAAP